MERLLWDPHGNGHCRSATVQIEFQQPDTPTTMGSCALGCLHCDNCRYATFSQKMSDCSLYSACNLSRLAQGHGYSTLDTANLGAGALVAALGGVPPPPPTFLGSVLRYSSRLNAAYCQWKKHSHQL